MSSQEFRRYYGSGETWYLAREVDTEIERLTQERDNAIKTSQDVREDYIALMREIQRYQPAGSLALADPSISVHGAPIAVRGLSNGHTEPVVEWTRMPSGAYVVLAGSANNFDSFWFDTNGKHPKSELIFESRANDKERT